MAVGSGKFVRHGPITSISGGLRQLVVDNSRGVFRRLSQDRRLGSSGSKR